MEAEACRPRRGAGCGRSSRGGRAQRRGGGQPGGAGRRRKSQWMGCIRRGGGGDWAGSRARVGAVGRQQRAGTREAVDGERRGGACRAAWQPGAASIACTVAAKQRAQPGADWNSGARRDISAVGEEERAAELAAKQGRPGTQPPSMPTGRSRHGEARALGAGTCSHSQRARNLWARRCCAWAERTRRSTFEYIQRRRWSLRASASGAEEELIGGGRADSSKRGRDGGRCRWAAARTHNLPVCRRAGERM